jgi:hypothetical protein
MPQPVIPTDQPEVRLPPTKSVGVSLALTLVFGPLGLLYSTVEGALLMILSGIGLGIVLGSGALVIWPVSMIWGAIAASAYNQKRITAYTG